MPSAQGHLTVRRRANDGKDGNDAVSIAVSPENVVFDYAKSAVQNITVTVYRGNKKLSYGSGTESGKFICGFLQDSDGNKVSPGNELTTGLKWSFIASDDGNFRYRLTHYASNDVAIETSFIVMVEGTDYERKICVRTVKDGEQGIPGPTYMPVRVREWAQIKPGSTLTTGLGEGDEWTDIVYEKNASVASGVRYWRCVKQFVKISANSTLPEASDTTSTNALVGYLEIVSNFGSLATDIFLANYALVKNLGVETIEMRDDSGNVLFEAKDGNVTCNTGNFKNINISGASTFKGFVFKEKTVITQDNYDLLTKTITDGSGNQHTEIDLLKTGTWIEVRYIPDPEVDDEFGVETDRSYTLLPTIRAATAYSLEYLDYVRQFIGNELIIYNSSGKSMSVSTGEVTVTINSGYGCYFRMVVAPETASGGTIPLERIKWEYTGPFQAVLDTSSDS